MKKLTKLASEVSELLKAKRMRLKIAESFTGGLISSLLVQNAGASEYLVEGIVCYSDESKVERLGVDRGVIDEYSAVSCAVCDRMLEGLFYKDEILRLRTSFFAQDDNKGQMKVLDDNRLCTSDFAQDDNKSEINTVDGKMNTVDGKMNAVGDKINAVDDKINAVDEKKKAVNDKTNAIDEKMGVSSCHPERSEAEPKDLITIATTGNADPASYPHIGFVGARTDDIVVIKKIWLDGSRVENISKGAMAALEIMRGILLG